ncbi:hypothetical protein, partial [Thiolapillus sp.]
MTRTAGAPIGCQRPSRFWGLGCPKIYHEAEDTLVTQCIFQIAVETPRLQLCAITACRCILQPQIHAYRLAAWG